MGPRPSWTTLKAPKVDLKSSTTLPAAYTIKYIFKVSRRLAVVRKPHNHFRSHDGQLDLLQGDSFPVGRPCPPFGGTCHQRDQYHICAYPCRTVPLREDASPRGIHGLYCRRARTTVVAIQGTRYILNTGMCIHLPRSPLLSFLQIIDILDGMTRPFTTPYIMFYPTVSRDGMPFPINKFIREMQGRHYQEAKAWRGNIVVAKYRDLEYSAMTALSIADFPLIKNYLTTHLMD